MITYLASYPRSGNSMLRIIFKEAFGLMTGSVYKELSDNPLGRLVGSVGNRLISDGWPIAKPSLVESAEQYFMKTHQHPEDNLPAIVLARDPRASIVSYWHLYHQKYPLINIIKGNCPWGAWDTFYKAWRPLSRPNTLFLRYEDMIIDPKKAIATIAEFIGLTPIKEWTNDFSRFQAIEPTFFRAGNNKANISELSHELEELILSRCRSTMIELGYGGGTDRLGVTIAEGEDPRVLVEADEATTIITNFDLPAGGAFLHFNDPQNKN